jgi:hypothetical protein
VSWATTRLLHLRSAALGLGGCPAIVVTLEPETGPSRLRDHAGLVGTAISNTGTNTLNLDITAGTNQAISSSGLLQGGIDYSAAEAVTINGLGAAAAGALKNLSGTNSFSGNITAAAAATIGSSAGALTLNGNVTTAASC